MPYRVDLFDDEIDSIRTFDPDTPAQPLPGARGAPAARRASSRWTTTARARFRSALARAASKATRPAAALQGHRQRRRDRAASSTTCRCSSTRPRRVVRLPRRATRPWCCTATSTPALQRFWHDTRERYRLLRGDPERPLLPPEALFLPRRASSSARQGACAARDPRGSDSRRCAYAEFARRCPPSAVDRGADDPLAALQATTSARRRTRVLLVAESDGRRETLLDFAARQPASSPPAFDSLAEFEASDETRWRSRPPPLARGFAWHRGKASTFVTETELFAAAPAARRRDAAGAGQRRRRADQGPVRARASATRSCTSATASAATSAWSTLDLGDRRRSEFLQLEYADEATLYVPVAQLHLISRYTGVSADEAPLHELGSRPVGQGQAQGRRAGARHRRRAAQPLRAARGARGPRVPLLSRTTTRRSPTSFGFEETPDQQAAIHAVIQDMISPQPMDRLVCGDVGFGKTEVALRAAFVAVDRRQAGRGPRADHAARRAALPDVRRPLRRVAGQGRRAVALPLRQGSQGRRSRAWPTAAIDIVVGTHKLLAADVKFKNLGLVIIDEEHRFGVRQKEAMKALRAEVDVLTLTATPIPRTLGMALEGLRDLSVIATAPQRRLAIKTFVRNEGTGIDPRGGAARAEARRPGLLPAQRRRDDREPAREARGAAARGAHRGRARPDARARARARDARLRRAALQPAAVLDHHRDRHRRADRQHHHHRAAPTSSAWRSCTSCAAASAARTTRPTPTCWCPTPRA